MHEQTLAGIRQTIINALTTVWDRGARDDVRVFRRPSSVCPLPPDAFDHKRVMKVVNKLPINQLAWARYAYADQQVWGDCVTVTQELWQAFLMTAPKLTKKKTDALKKMAFLAVQSWRHFVLHRTEMISTAKLMDLLGVSVANYRRDWLPHWRVMHELMQNIDTEVLLNVYRGTQGANFSDRQTAQSQVKPLSVVQSRTKAQLFGGEKTAPNFREWCVERENRQF